MLESAREDRMEFVDLMADAEATLLQIRRMLHERSSRQVSLGYYVILLAGFLLWISYGIAAQNLVLIIPNTIALLVGLTLVAVALKLRRPRTG